MTSNIEASNPHSGVVERPTQHWLFGPAPLIRGEDRVAYDECHKRIFAAAKCQDFLMEIVANDIVNLTWDSIRYRRAKAEFLSQALSDAISAEMASILEDDDAGIAFAEKWAARDADAIKEIEETLALPGLSIDLLTARVLINSLETIAQLDRMIASADSRRNAALRELERHRSNLAQTLRSASNDAIDAQFEDVKLQPDAGKLSA